MENKILSFASPKEHYQAEACIVWCYDARLTPVLEELIKTRGYKNYDLIKLAGGAKPLASPDDESERLFLLKQIKTSVNLHHTSRVILMNHEDCGAYGGSKAFKDGGEEYEKLQGDLKKAARILKDNLPEFVEIETLFVNFESVTKI